MSLERIGGREAEVLSRREMTRNGCCTVEEIYVKGHHPLGVDVEPGEAWSHGPESRIIKPTIRATHTFSAK